MQFIQWTVANEYSNGTAADDDDDTLSTASTSTSTTSTSTTSTSTTSTSITAISMGRAVDGAATDGEDATFHNFRVRFQELPCWCRHQILRNFLLTFQFFLMVLLIGLILVNNGNVVNQIILTLLTISTAFSIGCLISTIHTAHQWEEECKKKEPCTICFNGFTSPIKLMRCGHIFCKECILTWLEQANTCPHCRAVVTDDE